MNSLILKATQAWEFLNGRKTKVGILLMAILTVLSQVFDVEVPIWAWTGVTSLTGVGVGHKVVKHKAAKNGTS